MRMTSSARAKGARRRGMTLLEVLVAFAVFSLMIATLVTLATAGLDTWTAGEDRKDVYDRAQRILEQVSDDVRNTFADDAWHADASGRLLQHAYFVCDAPSGRGQRLRLVRAGGRSQVNTDPAARVIRPPATVDFTDLWEVAYVTGPTIDGSTLYRGVRFFDRRPEPSLLTSREALQPGGAAFRRHFEALDTGVLWLAFRFWTPRTTAWDETVSAAAPSALWDSSRLLREDGLARFVLSRPREDREEPAFCYPEIVEVTLVLESQASENRGSRLSETISESSEFVRLDSVRSVPDAPNYLRVGSEWIEYREKTAEGVRVKRRGARGTAAASHAAGDAARFGDTFVTEIRVPAHREPAR